MASRLRTAIAAFGLLASSHAAHALDPGREPSQYVIRKWGAHHLRSNIIHRLLQSRDGYVWLGTSTGLVRHDGDRFVVFNARNTPELGDGGVSALAEAPDGTLFVGTTSGLVLQYKDGRFAKTAAPAASGPISSLLVSRDGALWIGMWGRKTLRMHGGATTEIPSQAPGALAEDGKGAVWISTKNRGVLRHQEETTEIRCTTESVQALLFDRQGTMWIGTSGGLMRLRDGHTDVLTPRDGLAHASVTALLEDRDGSLWVGTAGGLSRLANGRWSRLTASFDGLSHDDVRTLLEDHEGNVWVGTANGLSCLTAGTFIAYGPQEGLRDSAVTAVAPGADNSLWVGTASGHISRFRGGREVEHAAPPRTRTREAVLAMREMRDGSLWITLDSERLLKLHRGVVSEETLPRGDEPAPAVRALFEDEKGPLFVATGNGFGRIERRRFLTQFDSKIPWAGEKYPKYPHMAHRGADGTLWLADRAGLGYRRGDRWAVLTTKDGLPADRVRWLSEDADGALWAATTGGLAHVSGTTVRSVTLEHGLPENHLRLVLDDGLGYLWMASAGQIFRASKAELRELFAGKRRKIAPRIFDSSDGLRSTEIPLSNGPGCRTEDGRLWFATANGLAVVDPRRPAVEVAPPLVRVEEVRVDEAAYDRTGDVVAPPGRGDLMIRYTGLSYVTPERVRFRYQLEGYDAAFVDAENRRVASYTNIPPGSYRFRVEARNGDGAWSSTHEGVSLELAPHFYQTRWFVALLGLSVLGAAMAVHRMRVRYLELRQKELSARVEDGLAQIKVLRGLLPTCASCHKIRDESGSWAHMESYIRDHSEANFSHGICPDCMAKLYPDAYRNLR